MRGNTARDEIFDIVIQTKTKRFNFTNEFVNESDNDNEPKFKDEPADKPAAKGYIVYQTAVHYPVRPLGPVPVVRAPGVAIYKSSRNYEHGQRDESPYQHYQQMPGSPSAPVFQAPNPSESHARLSHNQAVNYANNQEFANYNTHYGQRLELNQEKAKGEPSPKPYVAPQSGIKGLAPATKSSSLSSPFQNYQTLLERFKQQNAYSQVNSYSNNYQQNGHLDQASYSESPRVNYAANNAHSSATTRYKRQIDDDSSAGELCETRSMFITPRAALNDRSEWRFVVNVPERDQRFRQVIRVELCS